MDFLKNELRIDYDQEGTVEFIECSGLHSAHFKIFIGAINVFETPAIQLLNEIKKWKGVGYDETDDEIPYSFLFRTIDLSVYWPVLPDGDEKNEEISEQEEGKYFSTIGIGRKGYYEG